MHGEDHGTPCSGTQRTMATGSKAWRCMIFLPWRVHNASCMAFENHRCQEGRRVDATSTPATENASEFPMSRAQHPQDASRIHGTKMHFPAWPNATQPTGNAPNAKRRPEKRRCGLRRNNVYRAREPRMHPVVPSRPRGSPSSLAVSYSRIERGNMEAANKVKLVRRPSRGIDVKRRIGKRPQLSERCMRA